MNKVQFVAEIEYLNGSATCTSTHKGQLGYSCCSTSNLPITEINAESNVAPFPVMTSQLRVTIWLHRTISILEWEIFFSFWSKHFGYRLDFPICNSFTKTTILTYRMPDHCHGIPYSTGSVQETRLTVNEVGNRRKIMEFTDLIMCLTILEQLAWQNNVMALRRLNYSVN